MASTKLNRPLNVGVVGATGMVGQSFMQTLAQRQFPVAELRPFASENSLGKSVSLQGRSFSIQVLKPGCFDGLDLVFFSSGDAISKEWAPLAVKAGAWAIDNSAAFRMDPNIHLVVPEVNGDLLDAAKEPQIIANPNCSTIQLVVALNPLFKSFGIETVHVASYQAVSGAGQPAHDELLEQVTGYKANPNPQPKNFPHPIVFNCIPQIGSFGDNGFSSEEMKVMKETRKIMRAPQVRVSAMTVRVPVLNSHAEAVWVRLSQTVSRENILNVLKDAPGLVIQDDPKAGVYPMQRDATGQDPVYVGRLHQDLDDPQTWIMWVVADNIRKGAALNGIQIADRIFDIRAH